MQLALGRNYFQTEIWSEEEEEEVNRGEFLCLSKKKIGLLFVRSKPENKKVKKLC